MLYDKLGNEVTEVKVELATVTADVRKILIDLAVIKTGLSGLQKDNESRADKQDKIANELHSFKGMVKAMAILLTIIPISLQILNLFY